MIRALEVAFASRLQERFFVVFLENITFFEKIVI